MLDVIQSNWQAAAAVFGLSVFWLWETWAPLAAAKNRYRHAAVNLTVAMMNSLLLLAVAVLTVAIADAATRREIGVLHLVSLSSPFHFWGALLLYDMWSYWWHRINHRIPFLWRFHRMHHSDAAMDVSTATRFHPGEIVLSSMIRLLAIPLIGVPVAALVVYDGIQLASTQFHHANISLFRWLDRAVCYVIVSPNMHKVHHSPLRVETDSNYSSVLSVWDRIFGSYRELATDREVRFGLDEFQEPEKQSFGGMLRTPLFRLSQRP